MKSLLLLAFFCISCVTYRQDLPVKSESHDSTANDPFTKEKVLVEQFQQLLSAGVPGIVAVVYSDEGWWHYADGLAKIEDKTEMNISHLHYLQSVAKTFQSVAILKLYEEGKIDLDASIANYLPSEYSKMLPRADDITVRMLMSHTSGLPEYNDHPINITQLLQTPEKLFTTQEYLKVINGKQLNFEPNTRYQYRNTNYVLLSLISDQITGDHAKHISEVIFKPLGLNETYYKREAGYLTYENIVNTYWDRHSDGILENVSQMQRTNVESMIGDDGIVSTPKDAVKFLKGLMEGKLIKPETLEIMKQGYVLKNGKTDYGLGLDHATMGEKPAFGHSGGGLGAGCQLYYFPHNNTYFFIGINMGVVTEGPVTDKAEPILKEINVLMAK